MATDNEIISFGGGYDLDDGVKILVKSANKIGQKLTVLSLNMTQNVVDFLKENQVNLVDANTLAEKHKVDLSLSPYSLKILFYYLYCKYYTTSEKVLLSDMTDVCFRKNPFDLIENDRIYISSEGQQIKNCSTNKAWLMHCYQNPAIIQVLLEKEIINSGNILGVRAACVSVLNEMVLEISDVISRVGNYRIIDQIALNKIVHFDRHPHNLFKNREILNMAQSPNDTEFSNTYIVHQYNRNPHVKEHIREYFDRV